MEFEVRFETYRQTVYVILLDDFSTVAQDYDLEDSDYVGCNAFIYYDKDVEKPFRIFIKKDTDLDEIVHECVHIVNRLFYHTGVNYMALEDEVLCYNVQFLFRKIIEKLLETDFKFNINS